MDKLMLRFFYLFLKVNYLCIVSWGIWMQSFVRKPNAFYKKAHKNIHLNIDRDVYTCYIHIRLSSCLYTLLIYLQMLFRLQSFKITCLPFRKYDIHVSLVIYFQPSLGSPFAFTSGEERGGAVRCVERASYNTRYYISLPLSQPLSLIHISPSWNTP